MGEREGGETDTHTRNLIINEKEGVLSMTKRDRLWDSVRPFMSPLDRLRNWSTD